MSILLLPERPIAVLPQLAVKIGLNEAIAIQQLHYWISESKGGQKYGRKHEGKAWVYNTPEQWQQSFPFWSDSTIRRTFGSLEKQKLIITELEHDAAYPGGRRKWFAIDYDQVNLLGCGQNEQTPMVNLTTPSVQNEQAIYKESETTTESTPETTKELKDSTEPPAAVGDAAPAADESEPVQPPAETEPAAKTPTPHQAMFQAVCDALDYNVDTLTKTRSRQIGKVVSELVGASAKPEQVAGLWSYIKKRAAAEQWSSYTFNTMTTYWPDYEKTIRPRPVLHVPVPEWRRKLDERRAAERAAQ